LIRVENLTKNYGPVKAVKSISFDLNDGQVVWFSWVPMVLVKALP